MAATTGGGSAPPVVVRDASALLALAEGAEPRTIVISGSIDVPLLALGSNKTLLGAGSDATLRGGITLRGSADERVSNVIIRNLRIDAATSAAGGDGIQVHFAHHVWIDHVELTDAADGLLDIVHASDFVTVSSSRFAYTANAPDPTHRHAVLIGHDAFNAFEDRGHLNVTWHHNVWGAGVQRAMLARYGKIHLFDNVFASPGNENVLSAGFESSWLLENNRFEAVAVPHQILPDSRASIAAAGNVYEQTSGAADVSGTGFLPPYSYQLEPAAGLAEALAARAGPAAELVVIEAP